MVALKSKVEIVKGARHRNANVLQNGYRGHALHKDYLGTRILDSFLGNTGSYPGSAPVISATESLRRYVA